MEYNNESVTVFLRRLHMMGTCPICNKKRNRIEKVYKRRIRDFDLGSKKCYIIFEEAIIQCQCGYRGLEKLDFVDRYSHYTKRFEEYISELCKRMSLWDVTEITGIDWKTVKRIDMKYLSKLVTSLEPISPTKLGVDEVAYQKGHKYLTVIRDLDAGKVIWIGMGRSKETLDAFFKELGKKKCRKVEVIVLDMWDPYIASVKENTKAKIVFDKFHIAKKITEALDKIRRQEFAKADTETRKKFKKKRFIILRRNKRLDEKNKETLQELMKDNEKLYQAYLLKEQALDIFDEENEETALDRLDKWFENVKEAGLQQFETVVETIKSYFYGIVNYFKYRLTNAASEAFNNKINVIKRRAYGFHDIEYFMLKILQSCGWQ